MKRRKALTTERKSDVIDYLKEFVEQIKIRLELECVILYGSRARGDYQPHSDIDLMVIGNFDKPFFDRADYIYEKYNWNWGMDVLCYTPEEFEVQFKKGVVSALDSIYEGICIYGESFFKKYRDKLKILKSRGLRKDPPVWILPKSMTLD
ncbi:MAG: hypothetical protein GF383_13225 [Candidatus Lokiarchaeota archaeon]|nr:hypothetical protein [Candidatus Lokiarchaeota archaeon]MBD3342126.1 hypothetical protein [Candidatus Lokiarchaeota archaeon]